MGFDMADSRWGGRGEDPLASDLGARHRWCFAATIGERRVTRQRLALGGSSAGRARASVAADVAAAGPTSGPCNAARFAERAAMEFAFWHRLQFAFTAVYHY